MDGGAWWAAVYGVAQSRTRLKQLSSSSKDGWQPPEARREAWKCISLMGSRSNNPTDVISGFWPPELWENKSLLLKATQFVIICYSGPSKLIYSTQEVLTFYNNPQTGLCFKVYRMDFPGGPVAKMLHSQCKRSRFNPWLGN